MPIVEELNIYLSPRPWAHITVAVCFFKAGITRAAEPAIPSERYEMGIRRDGYDGVPVARIFLDLLPIRYGRCNT